ncbi:MAG: acyl-CoA desaturase [Ahrensia sp.]|nr:acyl-CoA desaturase [Ahrensia sp.]
MREAEKNPSQWISTDRVVVMPDTCATDGKIQISPTKTLWLFAHGCAGLIGVIAFPHVEALIVFLTLTAITICAGHSVGMHRLLIHRSFKANKYLEYLLVWLGVLVGMAGPFGMIYAHDMRDWHQRQKLCPPHPSHDAGFWRDAWWQLCCQFNLSKPPIFVIEPAIKNDKFYQFVERTWMAQQIPLGILLYWLGGLPFVLWGISLRIFVSLFGHWLVGHFAHRSGDQTWKIDGLPVQGYNVRRAGLITFGESWHANHHAFPHSAKLGLEPDQSDIGFRLILALQRLGLVSDVKLPQSEPHREGLIRVEGS